MLFRETPKSCNRGYEPPRWHGHSARGFSLMEVVVALAILGTAIAALIQLYAQGLRTTKKTSDYSTALVYARSYLDEAYAQPEVKAGEETFQLPGDFKAERTISLLRGGSQPQYRGGSQPQEGLALYEITVTVTWPPAGKVVLKGLRGMYEGP